MGSAAELKGYRARQNFQQESNRALFIAFHRDGRQQLHPAGTWARGLFPTCQPTVRRRERDVGSLKVCPLSLSLSLSISLCLATRRDSRRTERIFRRPRGTGAAQVPGNVAILDRTSDAITYTRRAIIYY